MRRYVLLFCVALFGCYAGELPAQSGPRRFESEVQAFSNQEPAVKEDIVLFTGSSSIRIWPDIESYFPGYNLVNRGFGGSETTDLLYYFDRLILPYKPTKIFIYEGDNDLAAGKSSELILSTTDSLLKKIRRHLPGAVKVYFISPKPSVARWQLRDKYLAYSKDLRKWISRQKNVVYIDGWSSLLDAQGNVRTDVFQEDNLHLNKKGYDLWYKAIRVHLP